MVQRTGGPELVVCQTDVEARICESDRPYPEIKEHGDPETVSGDFKAFLQFTKGLFETGDDRQHLADKARADAVRVREARCEDLRER